MVRTVMSTITMAMVAANDVTSLLQLSAGVRQSQGQRILEAIAAEGSDTICVQAAAGDVAPVIGSFTTSMGQQAVVVAAGSVAGETGSFCVAKQDILLIQRTFGLNSARDFEAALGSKSKATTTTTTGHRPSGDVTVKAGECPSVEAGLVQNVEASVSGKQQQQGLDADQLRVCACRNFLQSTVNTPNFLGELEKMQAALAAAAAEEAVKDAAPAEVLLQRNFDAALASKNPATTTTTTTTTTTKRIAESAKFESLAKACTAAGTLPGSWSTVAEELNNPKYADLFKSFNITGGWQYCDNQWVVRGACDVFVRAPCKYIDLSNKECVLENVSADCCFQKTVTATTIGGSVSAGTCNAEEEKLEAKCEIVNQ